MDITYRRMSDESLMAYNYRMCRNKDLGKYNLTWEELRDILNLANDKNLGESKWRKDYQIIQRYLDDATTKGDDFKDLLEEMELAKDELYKERVKTRDKLREYRKVLTNHARFENLQDTAIQCAEIMAEAYPFKDNFVIKEEEEDRVGVLLLSDFHYGITIDNFLNKFNKDICQDRVGQVIAETLETCALNNVNILKIVNLGDLINGFLHLTTRVENEEDTITQIMEASELLANMINKFAPHFNYIEYVDCLDNHSRVSPDKKVSIESENFSRLISWYLKPRLQNLKNVKIIDEKLDDSLVEVFVLGARCFAVHGHQDKVGSVVRNLSLLTKNIPEFIFMGHTHAHYEKDVMGIDIIVNGTLSGTDTYAKNLRLTGKAMQKLLIYKKVNGKVKRDITKHIEF